MTGPMPITPDDAEFQKWKAAHAAPQTHDDAEFQAWKAQQAQGPHGTSGSFGNEKPGILQRIAGALPQVMPQAEDFKAFTPSNLATEAQNLGQQIPGGKALQAVSQMLPHALGGQGLSYPEAYARVGQQVSGLPTSHKVLAGLAGGAAMGLTRLPAAAIGAVTPFVNSMLNPRPTTWGNAAATTAESGVGGVLPSAMQMIASRVKSGLAPTADVVANEAKGNRIAADQINYGKVEQEAQAAGGTNADIQAALAEPKIAQFVKAIRYYEPNSSDAEVLLKARALMSERQGSIMGPVDAADPGVGSSLEKRFLGGQKDALTQAATAPPNPAMPSLPQATDVHAGNMQARDAGDLAAKVARRQFSGTKEPVNSDKLEKLGLAGYAQEAASNTPAEAKMAQARILAELKNYPVLARLGREGMFRNVPEPWPNLATRQAPAMLKAAGSPALSDFLQAMLTSSATSPLGR